MFRNFGSAGLLLLYGLCLPLAIFAGYLLARPGALTGPAMISFIFLVMAFPLFLRWHHAFLIFAWNSYLIIFFLPGQPSLAVVLSVANFALAIVTRTLTKKDAFISVPSLTRPLLFLTLVVVATMFATGGFGARSLGSTTFGGRRYLSVFGAIIGYFALTSQAIPPHRRVLLASIFFLSGLTAAVSDLAYLAGPAFYFLYAFFPSNLASLQAMTQETMVRFSGMMVAGLAVAFFMLARFGISGLFDWSRPWRLLGFGLAVAGSLFGGFRSALIILFSVLAFQFYFEGLFRTRFFPIFITIGVLSLGTTIVFIERMPLAIQRSLSFLPINVHPTAKTDALSTLEWRLQIWKIVTPEVPKYLIKGKGYSYSGTDYFLTQEAVRRGLYRAYEDTLISGHYHNGLLTTLIPFGLFGFLGFCWFCWAAVKVLHANWIYGPPELNAINTFLIAFFCGRLMFFFVFYGQFELDLPLFTGTVALSVSLNHGVRTAESRQLAEKELAEQEAAAPQPAFV